MNANELADYLQNKAEVELQPRLQEAATMLRQQQAEIENLKAGLLSHYDIHPVKELTDEEILAISNENYIENKGGDIEFARAILRKAWY